MYQKTLALLCIWFCVAQAIQENPITLRVKRQECKCIRNPRSAGSMTCSCAKPMSQLSPNSVENLQQTEVAQALSDSVQAHPSHPSQSQARCGCVQIVYLGTAQYQCQCGEAPTTTTTTEAPTTLPPTTPVQYPSPSTNGPGQCQCVMIQISGPSSAQYQCNCHGNQQQYPALINDAPVVTPAPEVTETYPPITYAPELPPVEAPAVIADAPQQHQASPQYPLTTSCMVYVGVPSSPCVCLPQYDQCTQNICCLKAKFRSHKSAASSAKEPSTVDMLMNILHKIKTKLND